MTTVAEDDGRPSSDERNVCVPQQLLEANELLKSINRRLEDCALEWQAEISRKQWRMFNSKAMIGAAHLTERSALLARTYFRQKNLDEAFKHLLSCNKIFSEYLNDFIDLLRGDLSDSNVEERNVQDDRCRGATEQIDDSKDSKDTRTEETTGENRFPSTDDRGSSTGETIRDYLDNFVTVQNSFTDVIKAKLDFDTKFLGFEAVLHKATVSMSSEPLCLCQYSSSNMPSTRGRKLRSVTVDRRRNRTITKTKRLTGPARNRSSRKRKREESSIIIGDSGDRPLVDID
ncbi:uncharacterized protein LOC108631213 [Ceratina calcarata]|uniref:Uncharacterized protein LOC108631213 n=1 Tax=Ceratina calcarata TaxID=156304 RepID=A0AAJ7JDQ7_9HYME|nr:uncharacterized protein LOC108631213 [Ceratina calcarata]